MRIDASGNLGLGVTPSAWLSTVRAIQLGSGGSISNWTGSGGHLILGANYYDAGAGVDRYINTAAASKFVVDTGSFGWSTAPSGTAGNAITFTQAMTLDASGNLGIGTTSPTAKLHVNGSLRYMSSISAGGGLNVQNVVTANNNSANSIGGINVGFCVICISQGNGQTLIPLFGNSGGGIAWAGSLFDPDAGNFVYGAGPTVSFTTAGTGGNSYTLSMAGGTGIGTITRTAGSAAYTVTVLYLFEN
jgi:hypothetical protein